VKEAASIAGLRDAARCGDSICATPTGTGRCTRCWEGTVGRMMRTFPTLRRHASSPRRPAAARPQHQRPVCAEAASSRGAHRGDWCVRWPHAFLRAGQATNGNRRHSSRAGEGSQDAPVSWDEGRGSRQPWRAGIEVKQGGRSALPADHQRHGWRWTRRFEPLRSALAVPCSGLWISTRADALEVACWLGANQLHVHGAAIRLSGQAQQGRQGRSCWRSSAVEARGRCGSGSPRTPLRGRSGGQIQKALRVPDRRRWAGGCVGLEGFGLCRR